MNKLSGAETLGLQKTTENRAQLTLGWPVFRKDPSVWDNEYLLSMQTECS